MNNYIKIALLVVVAGLAVYFLPYRKESPQNSQNPNPPPSNQVQVVDFASCKAAGFPILESSPEQCVGPDGKLYVADIISAAEVVVDTPLANTIVTSPLTVKGKARGNWFFEANIPVSLEDQNGKVLAQKGFMTSDEWMTTDFVDFEGTLEFTAPTTQYGRLVIAKDNPSGLPQNDKEFVVVVRFR